MSDEAPQRIEELERRLEESSDLLRMLEWSGVYLYSYRGCPICYRPQPGNMLGDVEGHAPDCRLAKAIRGTP